MIKMLRLIRYSVVLLLLVSNGCSSKPKNIEDAAEQFLKCIQDNNYKRFLSFLGESQSEPAPDDLLKSYFEYLRENLASKDKRVNSIEIDPMSQSSIQILGDRYHKGVFYTYDPSYNYFEVYYIYENEDSFAVGFFEANGDFFYLLPRLLNEGETL